MDPTPDTPFRHVSEDWNLGLVCCQIVVLIAAYRARNYPPDMTAARLVPRLRCETCGERPREAAWQWAKVGVGGLVEKPRWVVVK